MAQQTLDEVVFYAWMESQPSNLTMRISGGQKVRDPQTDSIMSLGYHEVRFNRGIFRTRNPVEVAAIRKAITDGDTITEDEEVYLSKVQGPASRAERLAQKSAEDRENLKKKDDEVRELKERLAVGKVL